MRPGQQRGFPWLTSIIVQLHELDQYEDAELVRKKTAALFAAFITEPVGEDVGGSPMGSVTRRQDRQDYDAASPVSPANGGASLPDIASMEPGTVSILPPGMDIKFSTPTDVGVTYLDWIKQQLRETAAGIGTTYEELTGDLSGVNYSSIRAGIVSLRRRCEMLQAMTVVHQFCRPVAVRWLNTVVASGIIKIADYADNPRKYQRISWHGQGWDWVDPLKDSMAEVLEIRAGRKSLSESIIADGRDPDTVFRQIAQDDEKIDALGLIFDTDPRNTAKTGALQVGETAMAKESATGSESNASGE
jgi:lambda family phage portal protein